MATAWDFQIADGPFDTATHVMNRPNITDTLESAGVTYATTTIALPANTANQYLWRVRPAAANPTDPWLGCFPVHSFTGTGAVEEITTMNIGTRNADGTVPSGTVSLSWLPIEGAEKFNVYIGTEDANCQPPQPGTDVIMVTTEGPHYSQAVVTGIQPEEHYFVNIEPIGPVGFDGNASSGGCNKFEFDTTSLSAPIASGPLDGSYFDYDGPAPTLTATTGLGLEEFEKVRFDIFEMDASGNCPAAGTECLPASTTCFTQTVDTDPLGYVADLTVNVPPASRQGLCWQATGIAKNGKESPPSSTQKFYYIHPDYHEDKSGRGLRPNVYARICTSE